MNVLDLFSGIGGFSLGLERAGMRTVAFCEIDPYCQAVLRKHWPDVPIFGDVRTLTVYEGWFIPDAYKRCNPQNKEVFARRHGIRAECIDVICGGFPCQDISVAGKGAGIEGSRSGLWSEYARIIGEVRPRYVIVENVAALLGRGIERVLGDLATLGYDAEWHCIPASAVGAPHRRDRIWIVAYARSAERRPVDSACEQIERLHGLSQGQESPSGPEPSREDVAYASGEGLSLSWPQSVGTYWRKAGGMFAASDWWFTEPDVGRVAHGVPARVDRLRALGNAIVPQIAGIIGRAIMRENAVRK